MKTDLDPSSLARDGRELPVLPKAFFCFGEQIGKANIATDLGPRASEYIDDAARRGIHGRLDVVGFDGPNIAKLDYPWVSEYLEPWISKGLHIRYLLIKPSDGAKTRLTDLIERTKNDEGTLEVHILDTSKAREMSGCDFAEDWERFHFAVFNDPPQLWIENDHPPGETFAEGCVYFSPEKAKDEPLHTLLQSQFDLAWEKMASPLKN
ncbi:MAG: hypothetical protein WCH43_08880 [Verrucomicrobiota bacterium]